MKFNVIGDIHGRNNWKNLIDINAINIFVGDYFDPYDKISFENLKQNFLEIINYKKEYPENFILLYGNHDFHYLNQLEKYSRYDKWNSKEIYNLLKGNENLFHGICYTFDKYIVTHAGISQQWFNNKIKNYKNLEDLENKINNLWFDENKRHLSFGFECNSNKFDYYGTSETQSPIWIRPSTLNCNNLFEYSNIIQIVGHTQVTKCEEKHRIIYVDCLDNIPECFTIEI